MHRRRTRNRGLQEESRRHKQGARKLSHLGTGVGRETYWLSSLRRSSLATDV